MNRYYEPLIYIVPEDEDGWYLKTVMQRRMHVSRKLMSRLKLTERGITVNGERTYISARVRAGDRVELRMEMEQSDHILPQDMPLCILYEDDQLLIVDKPAGIVVHPTHGHYINTIANGVVHYWQQRGESFRFRPVHRLDQETSGVLAIAKNPFAHQNISEQMKANRVEKRYAAIVHGEPAEEEGTVIAPIDRDPEQPHRRIVMPPGSDYEAVTHYRVLRRYAGASLVGIRLETGRTHQIRVHMRHLGCPLFGDKLYGLGEEEEGIERHALHASELGFHHPVTHQWLHVEAELPEDMARLLERLEKRKA